MSDRGFHNPVIPGYHPDPSVCRVGDTYWCVTSSFTHFPGVPLFRSTDLVHWQQVGHVLDRPAQLDLSGSEWSSAGVYAPTIRYHDGRYYMITTVIGSGGLKLFFVTTDDPMGPWSDPVFVDLVGIDPDIAWDADGNCWVHFSLMQIMRARIDPVTGEVLSAAEPTWNGTGLHAPEAPHLYEIDGTWYLLIAEGGTERGHGVSIARGPSPTGPWEGCPHNPVLSHRSTSRPIQNTGHGDLVQAPDGSWWMLLLGVRAAGVTPHFHVMGRETFLTPVEWVDGWPVVAPVELEGAVSPPGARTTGDTDPGGNGFVAPTGAGLHPRWITFRRPWTDFAELDARGGLVLNGSDAALGPTLETLLPTFVGRRQQHHRFAVRATIDADASAPGADAGIAVVHDEAAHYRVGVEGDRIVARVRISTATIELGSVPRPAGAIVFAIHNDTDHHARPDTIHLGYEADDGAFVQVGEFDGRYLSTEVCGGFIGRVVGAYATACVARIPSFVYHEIEA
jgi:beta-xylosidase